MRNSQSFRRRGVVEGFFGPVWSMAHRRRLFEFGSARGMNTYVYAPKDDPYHRERWMEAYPEKQWQALLKIIRAAQKRHIGLRLSSRQSAFICRRATASRYAVKGSAFL
jgi:hypothetical protein